MSNILEVANDGNDLTAGVFFFLFSFNHGKETIMVM